VLIVEKENPNYLLKERHSVIGNAIMSGKEGQELQEGLCLD